MTTYADSSALLKRYVDEPDSERAVELLAGDPQLVTARHTVVEVRRNLARLLSPTDATEARAAFATDLDTFAIIELDADTCELAATVAEQTGVRSLDALHLGAARRLGTTLIFLTFDARQAQAAARARLHRRRRLRDRCFRGVCTRPTRVMSDIADRYRRLSQQFAETIAALLGCCDVIIATEGSNIGMGGPAMIEGGGLGSYEPSAIGPADVHVANGVVDVLVRDEAMAVGAAKQYLSYFRGDVAEWECVDQRTLRHLVPENRVRAYDVRAVIEALSDTGSVLELRHGFGEGMITALTRIEGRSVGIVANNPAHLGGAIDTPAADKAARFMQCCDAFDVPIVFLCDTPGFMVGPDSEATGAVRHMARMFVTGANLTVPVGTVILRKGYGLGAQAMAGGSFKAPLFCVAWPTGEFGGMNLEGRGAARTAARTRRDRRPGGT